MKIEKDMILSFSIIVTGRCNRDCPYCHFYANRDRAAYNRDIKDDLFDAYVDFIAELQKTNKNITVRFSGGEPLVLEDRLFELAERLHNKTGLSPFILTNGKSLSKDLIERAKTSHISCFVVSMDNPFQDDYSKENCETVLAKFKELENAEVPLYPGMVVINNNDFKDLVEIGDYFFERIGTLPPMCEKNFVPFEIPTDKELSDLYNSVKALILKYNGKSDLLLFPYIVPEYYANNLEGEEFLTELPMDDKFGFLNDHTFAEMLSKIEKQLDISYVKYDCKEVNCDWYGSCNALKWVWFSNTEKVKEYCRYKKAISSAFYDALKDE